MMKKLKRPLSILLSVMMVVSLVTIVPITAGAAQAEDTGAVVDAQIAAAPTAEDEAAADAVEKMISALPSAADVTIDDVAAVEEASAAYDALTPDRKKLVTLINRVKLAAVKGTLAAIIDEAAADAVEKMISALPSVADVTIDDKDAVEEAIAAYDALTPGQKMLVTIVNRTKLAAVKGVLAANTDEAAADAVEAMIAALPAADDVTADDKEDIENASAAYDALTDNQKKLVTLVNRVKLAAVKGALAAVVNEAAGDAVEAMIAALPAPSDVTIDDKAAVEEASAAYDALTPDQKNLVTLVNRTKLAAVKGALAAVLDEAAGDAVEAMIAALPAPSDVTIDDKAAVEDACEAYDALTPDQKKMVTLVSRVKLAEDIAAIGKIENDTAAAKAVTDQINALPAAEDVTLDDGKTIMSALLAYESLSDDQQALIDEDTYKKLTGDLDALDDLVRAEGAETLINALPDPEFVTINDKALIDAARDAYDNLSDAQKAQIDEDTYKKLTDAEEALKPIMADVAAAQAVSDMIKALPAPAAVTVDDKAVIDEASNAYDALTDAQKDYVPLADKVKLAADKGALNAAEKAVEDEAAASAVEDMIRALPAPAVVTLDDKAAVKEAKEAFDALTNNQKKLVTLVDRIKLAEDQAAIVKIENDIAAAKAVTDQINALPDAEDVTLDDGKDIMSALLAYNSLSDAQKELVDEDTYNKLVDDLDALDDLVRAENVENIINALPEAEDVTINDKPAIEAARAVYDNLSDDQKAKVDEDIYKKLTDDEAALAKAEEDAAAAKAVEALIEALPAPNKVTTDDKAAIEEVTAAYEALTDAQKAYVSPIYRIKLALDQNALADAEKAAEDQAAAVAVEEMIDALPMPTEVTLDDKTAIEEAAAAYDALTDDQKELVSLGNRVKLAVDELAIAKIEADNEAADAVKDLINALPAAKDVTPDDKAAIEEARAAYDALTNDQKALIDEDTYKKLTDAEESLNPKHIMGDVNFDGVVDILDSVMIQKSTVDKITLTDEEKLVADVNGDGVVDILDSVLIQKFTVDKIDKFPVEE